ncbi:MAG: hypothetical protein HKN42_02900 [Granulosicoccus sp.]|nr:hypothetical protein [Granulosicoccus sp.]
MPKLPCNRLRCFAGLFSLLVLAGCSDGTADNAPQADAIVTQYEVSTLYAVESLVDSDYHFPAIDPETGATSIQTLERFDLIFVGYDAQTEPLEGIGLNLASFIPGTFTHMLAYIGKDSAGFAYGIEMNVTEEPNYRFDIGGLKLDGRLYIYCLGSDYGEQPCPVDDHFYGLEIYDYRWARKLQPELKASLMAHENELMATIRQDLVNDYPYQLPLRVGIDTLVTGIVQSVDDGRVNGADCTSYLLSLFEEVAGVCLDEARMSATDIRAYFLEDPLGQQAILPARFNAFTDEEGDVLMSDLLTRHGYSLLDNQPRESACEDGRMLVGMPLPDKVFNSPSVY